ncbi:MAG: hypothetical protein WCB94_13370, partial [Terriglobales bacterium]
VSKLKLEVYDLVGVILPGLLVLFEGWVFFKGWRQFALSLHQLNGTEFTLLVLVAFGAGNLVQEFGDVTIKAWKGKRYFKKARDDFWSSHEALPVKATIKGDLGHELTLVDTAFDYCLTKLKDRFGKRDVFLATSDLCRSLAVLAILAFLPAARFAWERFAPTFRYFALTGSLGLLLIFLAWLAWKRMVRFRELSEVTVFRAYLAMVNDNSGTQQG